MNYEIRYVRGHVEVYDHMGRFGFSADSVWVALAEREQDSAAYRKNNRIAGICRARLPI